MNDDIEKIRKAAAQGLSYLSFGTNTHRADIDLCLNMSAQFFAQAATLTRRLNVKTRKLHQTKILDSK